jgi:drug/metabolite transporter (DMT)-like permease
VKRVLDRFGVPAALVGVAVIWGFTFVLVASAVARYPMFGFLGWRFAVAALTFVVLFPRVLRRLDSANLSKGLAAGALLTAGYIFQTWGLAPDVGTTPARAAFITGLYVILVPLMQAVWLRRLPRAATLLGAGLALGGLWLLSGAGQSGSWSTGDTLVGICALAYSLHMIVLGSTDERHDTAALTFVQLLVAAVVCTGISLITEEPTLPPDAFVWMAIVLCGVLASAVAFVVQTWAQRRIPPARVALILVTEPAFGGLFGWTVAGVWPIREVMGAALMLGGMITSEIVSAAAPVGEHVEFEAAMQGMPVPLLEDGREPDRMFADKPDERREV